MLSDTTFEYVYLPLFRNFTNSSPKNDKIIIGLCCEHAYEVNSHVFSHKWVFFGNLK